MTTTWLSRRGFQPACRGVNDPRFPAFRNLGGAVLTPRLRFPKNNMYALSILWADILYHLGTELTPEAVFI
jgi:hypothetical protein